METKVVKVEAVDSVELCSAAEIIKNGGLVVFPTETVYGLGADALNENAAKKIYAAKGRPSDNPLIIHIADPKDAEKYTFTPPEYYRLAELFMPGPITVVMKARDIVPLATRGGLETVAVRCPENSVARRLISLSGVPIAAPSANLSGSPSPTNAKHVMDDMMGRVDLIIDGGDSDFGLESTIVKIEDDGVITLLRPGKITPEDLQRESFDVRLASAVTEGLREGEVALSPGMKYKHYAPQSEVVIVGGSREKAAAYICHHFEPGDRVLCFEEELPLYEGCNPLSYGQEADVNTLSAGLFGALRELDDPSIHQVYARCPVGGGVAYAVQNRLKKAAAFHTCIFWQATITMTTFRKRFSL